MDNKEENRSLFTNVIILIEKIWKRLLSREVITYLVAGVLTTVVNLGVFYAAAGIIGIEELISNTIAWIIAVAFAYLINSLWVFKSKFISGKDETEKVIKFVSGRIASFLVEQAGILVFVKWLNINSMLVKAGLAVVVIIMNYIISKLFVFKKIN